MRTGRVACERTARSRTRRDGECVSPKPLSGRATPEIGVGIGTFQYGAGGCENRGQMNAMEMNVSKTAMHLAIKQRNNSRAKCIMFDFRIHVYYFARSFEAFVAFSCVLNICMIVQTYSSCSYIFICTYILWY